MQIPNILSIIVFLPIVAGAVMLFIPPKNRDLIHRFALAVYPQPAQLVANHTRQRSPVPRRILRDQPANPLQLLGRELSPTIPSDQAPGLHRPQGSGPSRVCPAPCFGPAKTAVSAP